MSEDNEILRLVKTCTKCGESKPESGFYADKRRPAGLQSECKQCVKARSRVNHEANRERGLERRRAYYAMNRDRQRQVMREWYLANREQHAALARKWRHENPQRKRDMEQNRRARAGGYHVEDVDRMVVLAIYEGCCGICGEPVDAERFDIDHIVPIARGGMHSYENVQPAHGRCNQSKKNRLMHEHRARQAAMSSV